MKKCLLILGLMVFLVGCGGGSSDTQTDNWKTGTQGIEMRFSENAPPIDMFRDETYSLVLELRNRGSFPGDDDELDVDLFFSGFDPELIDLPDSDSVSIEGSKSATNPEGGIEFYEQEFDVGLWEDVDSMPQDIRVTACYFYETFAPIDICVDPDPTRNEDDTCRPSGGTGGGGQAAPIAVTSVQQESLKGKVRLTIRIANQGGGLVLTGGECLRPPRADKDVVDLLGVFLGSEDMDCTPEERVRLINGVGTITCTLDGFDEDLPSFLTSLGVQLGYDYKQSVTKRVTIKKID